MEDPKFEELHNKIKLLRDELKEHAAIVDDPKCAALCETSSEAVGGLEKAFNHYMSKQEKAWQ